jgi:hypothetical protein
VKRALFAEFVDCPSRRARNGIGVANAELRAKSICRFATTLSVVATKPSLERATSIEPAFSAWEADGRARLLASATTDSKMIADIEVTRGREESGPTIVDR